MSNGIDFNAEMQELADVIVQYAPESWEKMCVEFEEFEKDSTGDYGIDSWAIVSDENIPVDFDEEDIDNLEKIFRIIQKKSIKKWKIAHFEFNSDGYCEMNFKY